jgi:hypothetical protein
MVGIVREWHKELIDEYRKMWPDEVRDDFTILEAIIQMREPKTYNKYMKKWMFGQIYEDQETIESLLTKRSEINAHNDYMRKIHERGSSAEPSPGD